MIEATSPRAVGWNDEDEYALMMARTAQKTKQMSKKRRTSTNIYVDTRSEYPPTPIRRGSSPDKFFPKDEDYTYGERDIPESLCLMMDDDVLMEGELLKVRNFRNVCQLFDTM